MTFCVKENSLPFIPKISASDYPPINIIVAVDSQDGIGKDGKIPWKCTEDMQFFRRKTLGLKSEKGEKVAKNKQAEPKPDTAYNAMIFGRKTFESITPITTGAILPGRIKIVISASMLQQNYELPELTPENATSAIFVFAAFDDAVNWCNRQNKLKMQPVSVEPEKSAPDQQRTIIRKIYACGGAAIYAAANYHPQLHKIYVTTVGDDDYNCDVFYRLPHPDTWIRGKIQRLNNNGAVLNVYKRCNPHEMQYLGVMRNILLNGCLRPNRTGVKTYSLFSQTLEYPLIDHAGNKIMPLLTTKRVFFITCYKELLWFLAGGTNAKSLQAQNVHIWDGNSSREFLDAQNLQHYKTGQLGPVYGAQWRHFGGEYNAQNDTMSGGVDQIATLIKGLKTDPFSRRHVLSAWNPADLAKMALPPCHLMSIFYVEPGANQQANFLNCKVIIRSNDMFLGHPFNVASYAALTHMIAAVCGMRAKRLVIDITDCHVYENHVDQVNVQLSRAPYGFPSFCFSEEIEKKMINNTLTIEDFNVSSIVLKNYICGEAIKGEMAK